MKKAFLIALLTLCGCISKVKYSRDLEQCRQERSGLEKLIAEYKPQPLSGLSQQELQELEMYRKMYRHTMEIQRSVNPLKK